MKPDRAIAQMLAAAAIVALLAIGSAVYTVAGSNVNALAIVAGAMPIDQQARSDS